jgi:hypothetical protein
MNEHKISDYPAHIDVPQPHIDELVRAWNAAIECADIGGARSETLLELIRLRTAKTTWFGKYENDMRTAIDKYLEAQGVR